MKKHFEFIGELTGMPDVWMKISQASTIFQKMKLDDVVAVLDVFQVSFKKTILLKSSYSF
jgi:hypothetical protein